MHRRALSVVVVAALAIGVGVGLGLAYGRPPIDWLFATLLTAGALLVGTRTWSAYRASRRQRRAAARLDRLDPRDEARRAVVEERRRLTQDIEAGVRDSLDAIAGMVDGLDEGSDPRPVLVAIQAEATTATTDVRRRLGLLRAESATVPAAPARGTTRAAPGAADWAVTAGVVVVGALELVVLAPMEGVAVAPLQVVLSLGAAGTLLERRRDPLLSSVSCAALLALASLVGAPVLDGFWLALTLGLLGWSCAAVASIRAWIVLVLLGGSGVLSRFALQPDNARILLVAYSVVVLAGAAYGRSRRRQSAARAHAEVRRDQLEAAGAEAVAAERRAMARELHDVVSHALSVIAVQAGAAELSWATDRAASRRAMDVISSTARVAVAELDRLAPGSHSTAHDVGDLHALADRMRAAQLDVALEVDGEASTPVPETVYRVVQETLTNVLRHAQGAHAWVHIHHDGDRIVVDVFDDGPGSAPDSRRGYGLIGLAERLRQAGGTLVTRSRPEVAGFQVTAVVPSEPAGAAR